METNNLIKVNNLTKKFPMGGGWFTALEDINLRFGKGEFAGIVGPSGSGKTTLLNIIGSLDDPTGGEAIVLGRSIGKIGVKEAARLQEAGAWVSFSSRITFFRCIMSLRMSNSPSSCWI